MEIYIDVQLEGPYGCKMYEGIESIWGAPSIRSLKTLPWAAYGGELSITGHIDVLDLPTQLPAPKGYR